MLPNDTSERAQEVYFQRLAAMTPAERIGVGAALWESGHALQRAAMRRKHPGAADLEINFQIAVTRYGAELARKAYQRT